MDKTLPYYIHCFRHLNRDRKNGGAPHKPILLLSVIDLFDKRTYSNGQIFILPELVSSFRTIWNQLVETKHDINFAMPFYHMRSEPFWQLVPNLGFESWLESKISMRSFANLNIAVYCARIDDNLCQILNGKVERDILRSVILDEYFPKTKYQFDSSMDLLPDASILNESTEEYKRTLSVLRAKLDAESYQEEVFVRSGLFKREIPRIYDNTCAISKMRVNTLNFVSMVDACHIVPFSEGSNDSLTNGIALCPNLHRAFDRGLISVSDDYKVLVKSDFIENINSPYNIIQFRGKEILLPKDKSKYPSIDNFRIHRKKFGF